MKLIYVNFKIICMIPPLNLLLGGVLVSSTSTQRNLKYNLLGNGLKRNEKLLTTTLKVFKLNFRSLQIKRAL